MERAVRRQVRRDRLDEPEEHHRERKGSERETDQPALSGPADQERTEEYADHRPDQAGGEDVDTVSRISAEGVADEDRLERLEDAVEHRPDGAAGDDGGKRRIREQPGACGPDRERRLDGLTAEFRRDNATLASESEGPYRGE